jgi:hypothetical protein
MERKPNTFIFDVEWMECLAGYPSEVRLEVYEAIVEYASTGETRELKPIAAAAFRFIKRDMDRNAERYADTVRKRSEAGAQGGRPRKDAAERGEKPNAFSDDKEKAKKANAFSDDDEKAKKANGFSDDDEKAKKANGFFAFSEKPNESKKSYNYNYSYNDNNINSRVESRAHEEREDPGRGSEPPGSESPGVDSPEEWNSILGEITSDGVFLEQWCMNEGARPEDFRAAAEAVFADWRLRKVGHRDRSDTRNHLISQVRIKIREIRTSKNQRNGNSIANTRKRKTPPEPGFGLVLPG